MKRLVLLFLMVFLFQASYTPSVFGRNGIREKVLVEMHRIRINNELNQLRFAPFSFKNLYAYLTLRGASHKEIIIRQAILETGHFESKNFKRNNNLFGMKMPRKRETTAIKSNKGYAVYRHWTDSVDDYLILQGKWKIFHLKDFWNGYHLLEKVDYAENPNYIKLLKQIKLNRYEYSTSHRESTCY